ncbi:sodium-coupled monocarboxylate transporter 1-like [Ylistrum balloti]|uniref:sodium-coupled monocarboxylate transporter 1-like n=1 Tax=Ylistrum balloti TaxID=509963 RepID=UPI002905AA72|nr:sodium-coupled monocarboxylate transporter 1-like [Ylistrum balloti]
MANRTFHPADYIIFAAMLIISAGIGVFHAFSGGRQSTNREFLMANRQMRSLPVALSVLASFFSASTLLGTPAEIYQYGTQYWMSVFGAMLAPLTGALLFGPMFFNLKIVSVFEYLELRFNSKSVRLFGATLFLVRATLGMGIVLYGPSTALSAVTNFPVWAIILMVGGVCTFYTTLGGMRAVIWTDVFQTLVMLVGMIAVFIQGSIQIGGLSEMWKIAYDGDRIEFFNFDTNPQVRHTFWSLVVGIYFVWLPPYTVDQQMVQRFSSAKSLKDAKFALLCNLPGMLILITLCSLVGVVLYANYATCDPLKNNDIENANQLLPYFVMEIFSDLPGLPGLFVACIFSGALSSVSSMLNSLAAVTWEDFLKLKLDKVDEAMATKITKALAVVFGCLGVGMAFVVEQMGGTVLQASLTFNGAIGAPLVGVFILGACFTRANWIGALAGGILGFIFPIWLGIGKYVRQPQNFRLPTNTMNCSDENMTSTPYLNTTLSFMSTTSSAIDLEFATSNGTITSSTELTGLDKLYGVSYLWFSAIGILTVVVIGLVVSWVTGTAEENEVADNLQLHFWRRIYQAVIPHRFKNKGSETEEEITGIGGEHDRELTKDYACVDDVTTSL